MIVQTTSLVITELLRRVRENSITIPQFQRPFVWKDNQVKLLVDSISRNYPIGSVLLLTKSTSVTLMSRSIAATIREGVIDQSAEMCQEELPNEQYYVLDGQQRITSIVRVFMNAHPDGAYYFDIKSLIEDYSQEDTGWIVYRAAKKGAGIKNSTPERKDKNKLLRSDVVLDQAKTDIYVSEYIEDSDDLPALSKNKQKMREAAARVKGIFERLRNYQLPIVTIERDAQVESVCRIFETINSTGTRLTTFDLAVARFFPTPNLRSMWEDAKEDNKLFNDFDVDGERVLQVICLQIAAERKNFPEATRGAILNLDQKILCYYWNNAVRALSAAYFWAMQNGARSPNIPNHGVVTVVAAIFALQKEGDALIINSKENELRRWYFAKILQQGAKQASNYKIGKDFRDLYGFVYSNDILGFEIVDIDKLKIETLKSASDVRYKGLQSFLAMSIDVDIFSGKNIGPNVEYQSEHHIFPRGLLKKYKYDYIDSIANRITISESSSRSYGETPPYEVFSNLREIAISEDSIDEFSIRMKKCFIPGDATSVDWVDQFRPENYNFFIKERSVIIWEKLNIILGGSLISSQEEFFISSE